MSVHTQLTKFTEDDFIKNFSFSFLGNGKVGYVLGVRCEVGKFLSLVTCAHTKQVHTQHTQGDYY